MRKTSYLCTEKMKNEESKMKNEELKKES